MLSSFDYRLWKSCLCIHIRITSGHYHHCAPCLGLLSPRSRCPSPAQLPCSLLSASFSATVIASLLVKPAKESGVCLFLTQPPNS